MGYIYEFDKNKCWWRFSCPLYGDEKECTPSCLRYVKMHYLVTQSLLTEKQQCPKKLFPEAVDVDAFRHLSKIKDNIVEWVADGNNLMIWSQINGNGKTAFSVKLLLSYLANIWVSSDFQTRALFINVTRFLTGLKDSISIDSEYVNHIKDTVLLADLVVWDDIGIKNLTGFEHDYLYTYINNRIDNGKANIFTANLTGTDLREAVGDRLYSRIVNGSDVVQFKGADRRGLQ